MFEWYIGINTNFGVSAGKMGKYFKKYLTEELYDQYKQTYCDSDYKNFWTSIFTACELFRNLANKISDYFGFDYNVQDDENMISYLLNIKNSSYDD